jgi:hypothetical protein
MTDVAAFDFDGTLTDGGSVFDFLAAVVGRKTVLRATVELAPRLARAALAGGTVADRTKEDSSPGCSPAWTPTTSTRWPRSSPSATWPGTYAQKFDGGSTGIEDEATGW